MAHTALLAREGSAAFVLPRYAFYSDVKHYRLRILVCDMPSGKRLEPLKAGEAEMSQGARDVAAMQLHKQKNGPGNPGPVVGRNAENFARAGRAKVVKLQPYRPKRGRSPLRAEMRALAISARSSEAMKRAKKLVDVARSREAVFDMI